MSGELFHLAGTVGDAIEWAQAHSDAKAVVILAQDSDGAWSGMWSRLNLKELCFAERVLRFYVDREVARAWTPID